MKNELNLLMLRCALARKNGGDGGGLWEEASFVHLIIAYFYGSDGIRHEDKKWYHLNLRFYHHGYYCPFLGSSFGQAKEEQKKKNEARI